MLVIPAIEIKKEHCVRSIVSDRSVGGVYSNDPAAMAQLWRRENAKTIHFFDFDGVYNGSMENRESIIAAAQAVEIPVQLVARFADVAECEDDLRSGIYRLFLHDLILRDPDGVRSLVERYGTSRICGGAITQDGMITATWRDVEEIDAIEFADRARELGIRRIFFTDRNYEGVLRGPNFDGLRRFAESAGMQITAAGGVASVEHLWMLQEMEKLGIDSVVIGRAFYENCFPCQQLWRDIEAERQQCGDLWKEGVSTSSLTDTPPVPRREELPPPIN